MKRLAWLPALILAFWVERNCTLPWIPKELGWPWIFVDGGWVDQWAWNMVIVLAITGLSISLYRSRILPWTRILIIGAIGVFSISLWQPTGMVIYQWIPHAVLSSFVSFFIFWSTLGFAFRFENDKRQVAWLILCAVFFTPFLTVDRTLVGIGVMIFLGFQNQSGLITCLKYRAKRM
jgi:hypothetical protein